MQCIGKVHRGEYWSTAGMLDDMNRVRSPTVYDWSKRAALSVVYVCSVMATRKLKGPLVSTINVLHCFVSVFYVQTYS
jgi:hypothetical protein